MTTKYGLNTRNDMDSMNRLKWIVALMRNAIVSRQSIGDTTRKKDDFIYCIIFKSGTMSDNNSYLKIFSDIL